MLARGPCWVFCGIALIVLSCGGGGAGRDAGGGGSGGGDAGGADGGASACATVSSCGGDVVGTWQVMQSCLSLAEDLSSACPGASAVIAFTFAGMETFNADHTYTATTTGGGTTHYHYPGACVP